MRGLDERDLATYLSIAKEAAELRAADGRTPITFTFSDRDRSIVARTIGASSGDIGGL
jgi:hypothetical protein